VELEKDGWEWVDMLWCQGAKNTGLSNHELKSALKNGYGHKAHPPETDGQPDRQMNIMATA